MRILFMGTSDFSVPALTALIESDHEVVGVVTQPDRPKGRGNKVLFPPVKEKALESRLPVYQPQKVRARSFLEQLAVLAPDVIIVAAFGQILSKALLQIPRYGCINIHASLLPKYRGAAPIQWCILNGETETGITIMQMDEGIDTGAMLMKEVVSITPEDTGGTLQDKLSGIGGPLVLKALRELEAGTAVRIPQDDSQSNYAPILTKELGWIDWQQPAAVIERKIRGLNPWPSAYTKLDGKTLKLWKASVSAREYDGIPGQVVDLKKDALVIKTGLGNLEILDLQLEGKKRMAADVFLRGNTIEKGTFLG